jgi:penicillin-binding protein 1B
MARGRFWKTFFIIAAAVVGVGALVIGSYAVYLDHIVTEQFEGRRWTLPAHVYAAPLELYAGLPLTQADIKHELARLQYRPVDKLERPGTYHQQGSRIDVALRPAAFADETRPATILTIESGPPRPAADRLPQAARGDHGDGAGGALQQGRSHERLHQ